MTNKNPFAQKKINICTAMRTVGRLINYYNYKLYKYMVI